jgi:hypothetical protein
MAAMSGMQQGAARPPLQGPPTMSQPGGFTPRPDVFQPYFQHICDFSGGLAKAMRALADMLMRPGVGDSSSAAELRQLALKADEIGVKAESLGRKRAEYHKKIDEAQAALTGRAS